MDHSTTFFRKSLIWCLAVLLYAAVAKAGSNGEDVKNLTREQLISRYTFFGGDSLASFDFEQAYRKALDVERISTDLELRNFYHIEEQAYVRSRYHLSTVAPQRPGRDYRNPLTGACQNMDFEQGNWSGWSGGVGYNTNSNGLLTITGTGIISGALNSPVDTCQFHTLISNSYAVDPFGCGFPAIDPGGGNYCARLGGDMINLYQGYCNYVPYQSWSFSSGEYIEQTIPVTLSNALFTYSYAVILQNAPHPYGSEPYFHAEVFDSAGNSISGCFEYYVQANDTGPPPGFMPSCLDNTVSYLPWTQNSINLASYVGQNVTVRFTAAGCCYGGHWGYAYVDVGCSPVQIVITNGAITCAGTTTLVAPPAAGGTYSWAGPPGGIVGSNTSQIITVQDSGWYQVTIHPTTGCDYTLSTYVTASPNITGHMNPPTPALCFGGNTGTASVTALTGTAPYTYAWSPGGATTATASNLAAGVYTVTVTDANGCTYVEDTTVAQPAAMAANADSIAALCYGSSTGRAFVQSATGGTAPYTYVWSPSAQTGVTATNLTAGNYVVTVTDAHGCTRQAAVTVTQPTQMVLANSITNARCNGASNGNVVITANGGTGPYTYAWNAIGGTTATASNLAAGTYTVTVTDRNGCTKVNIASVSQPNAMSSGSGPLTNIACYGGSNGQAIVSANGGTPGYTYSWSPSGGTTATANALVAGNYTCTITDNHGCSIQQPVVLTQPTALASVTSSNPANCNGQSNGSATVTPSGATSPYTYLWSSGSTAATANGLAAGSYTVTVTDAHGCTMTTTSVVTEPTPVTAATGPPTNISCFGLTDGSAYGTGGGGVGPYTYWWTPANQSGQTATGLSPTTYTVRVTDSHGCTQTATVLLTQPTAVTAVPAHTNVSCNGMSDGSASVNAGGGTSPYAYLWTSGSTTSTANNLAAGTYSVTVTDANGCSKVVSATVTEPALLTVNTGFSNITCNGGTNGSVSITPAGGIPPYTYLWSSGNTTATVNNLAIGTYTATVTDRNGCSQTATISLVEPTAVTAVASPPTNVTCFGYNNGSASVTPGGGVPPYTYLWNPSTQTNQIASNLGPNTYTVRVTDSYGCTQTTSVTITEPTQVTAVMSAPTNVTCYGFGNGSAYVTPGGGIPPYIYSWSPSAQTGQTATSLTPNNYSVSVTDANGCSVNSNVVITQPTALTAVPSNTNVSCFGLSDANVSVVAGGGIAPYNYLWTPTANTTSTVNGVPATNYTVSITDVNGCVLTSTMTVTQPTQLLSNTTTPIDVVCSGQNNGSVSVVPSGGTQPYSYLWSTGETTSLADSLFAGTYTATVLDAHGCLSYSTATITQPTLLVAQMLAHTDNLCYGDLLGTATVGVNGGSPGYQYVWSPSGGTDATAQGMGAGNYTVIITDTHACTTKQLVQITQPPPLTMSVNTPPIICIGQNTDLSATVGGGTPPYNYVWDNGNLSSAQNVNPDTTTSYVINVTDANGCTIAAQTITVNVYPPLTFSANGPPSVCNGTVVTLNSGGSGGNGGPYTYTWDNGQTTSSVTLTITQDTTLNVTFSDGCSPAQQASVSVINNPIPIVNFSPWVTSGCAPLTVDFVDSTITVPGATYAWTLGDGTASGTQYFSHVYPNPGVYDISLTVTTPANCTSSLSMPHVVEVFPIPEAEFATSADVVEFDYPVVNFANLSSDADMWHWDFGDGSTDTLNYSPAHQYADTGYYSIQLAVMNDHGCVDTIYGRIYVRPEWSIFIPNNFTPNGDGKNDTFNALGTNIIDYDMWILDRWGGKIYHSESMGEPWNGTYFNNGKECQTDVYVYKIKAKDIHGKMHTFIGHVTLWR